MFPVVDDARTRIMQAGEIYVPELEVALKFVRHWVMVTTMLNEHNRTVAELALLNPEAAAAARQRVEEKLGPSPFAVPTSGGDDNG